MSGRETNPSARCLEKGTLPPYICGAPVRKPRSWRMLTAHTPTNRDPVGLNYRLWVCGVGMQVVRKPTPIGL